MFNECSILRLVGPKTIRQNLANNGAQDENRTHDLRITSALLYRLSYLGKDFTLWTSLYRQETKAHDSRVVFPQKFKEFGGDCTNIEGSCCMHFL
ncbi:MAG: hypothetical protein RL576_1270 [Actinomycetota bacterium]